MRNHLFLSVKCCEENVAGSCKNKYPGNCKCDRVEVQGEVVKCLDNLAGIETNV